jgi:hypothetical protein
MSEHNEKYEDDFHRELEYLTTCLQTKYNCDGDILETLRVVVEMSYELGKLSKACSR